jgi:hypothetical protein
MKNELVGKECVIRTYSAGVFFGKLKSISGKEAVVEDAIRLWYWDGAASLSQLAVEGVKKPENCKFGVPVSSVFLTEVIEVIPATAVSVKSVRGVSSWRQ